MNGLEAENPFRICELKFTWVTVDKELGEKKCQIDSYAGCRA